VVPPSSSRGSGEGLTKREVRIATICLLAAAAWAQQQQKPASQYYVVGDFEDMVQGDRALKSSSHCVGEVKLKEFSASVQLGAVTLPGTLAALCPNRALVEVASESTALPTSVTILHKTTGQFQTAAYVPGLAYRQRRVTFYQRGSLCGICDRITTYIARDRISLYPEGDVKDLRVLDCGPDSITIAFIAPVDYRPKTVFLRPYDLSGGGSALNLAVARAMPGVWPNLGQANVSFTVVDDESASRNFGKRIADNYLVIDLQVRNPSTKKVQIRKSAVWFEVDYRSRTGDVNLDTGPCTAGVPANGQTARQYLFGRDHSFEHHSEDFLTVMGSFDQASGAKDRWLQLLDIVTSGASGLTFLVQGTLFPQTVSWATGVVVPTFRKVVLSPEEEKRRRSQLLTQSFGDIIQIGPQSSESTKVFLARTPIAGQFPEPVTVSQVRDVHLVLEVVSEAVEEAVAKGELKLGMTQDQVSQAIGLPDSITRAEEQATWHYNSGRFVTLSFNREGKLIGWTERALKDQLAQQINSISAEAVKRLLGLIYTPSPVNLKDGGYLWRAAGNTELNLVFSKDNLLRQVNDEKDRFTLLAGFTGNIIEPEVENLLEIRNPANVPALGKPGRIWREVGAKKLNLFFDQDRVLRNANQVFVAEEVSAEKGEGKSFTREQFEERLRTAAQERFAGLAEVLKAYTDALKQEIDAKVKAKASVFEYPALESPALVYRAEFADGALKSVETRVKQP
jgi:hypothetical protein